MGRIAVHEFITLDGVVESPSWSAAYPFVPEMGTAISALMEPGTELLLGRRTYEMFAPVWSGRTAEDDPGAPFFNESPKHVVSGTLKETSWSGSSVLGAYDPATIAALKDRVPALYVSGSVQLVRAMLADGLVDELHLFVYPLSLGAGQRLFEPGGERLELALAACEAFENQVVHLTYGPGG